MKHITFSLSILCCFFPSFLFSQKGTLVFSEIFYDSPLHEYALTLNPGSSDLLLGRRDGGEFIEFYNPTKESVDVSKWVLKGTNQWEEFRFPQGTVIAPKEFVIVAYRHNSSTSPMHLIFPDLPKGKLFYQGNIVLNNEGERLILEDSQGRIRDRFDNTETGKGAKYKWDLTAINGYVKGSVANKSYYSIQRCEIRESWDEVKYSRNDYEVAYATPFYSKTLVNSDIEWEENVGSSPHPDATYGSTMNGNLSVSPTGAAIYDIPIVVPQGRGGLTPQLSISYNSQIRDGLLGTKWGINGLSSIIRTNKSYYFDSYVKELSFESINSDGLLLDGVRLAKLKDGTYRAETDPFTVIKYDAGSSTFQQFRLDGTVVTYGGNANAVSSVDSKKIFVWNATRIEDANGNYITFDYIVKGNESFIKQINYTGNSVLNLSPCYSIQFNYSGRSYSHFSYVAGKRTEKNSILTSLSVFYGVSKLKEYTFEIRSDKLVSITELLKKGTQSSSIRIGWDLYYNTEYYKNLWNQKTPLIYGDFMGKGYKQALVEDNNTYLCTNIDGKIVNKAEGLPLDIDYERSVAGDVNGDGMDDLLMVYDNECEIYLSNGKGFSYTATIRMRDGVFGKPIIGDFDGDGTNEIVFTSKLGPNLYLDGYLLSSGTPSKVIEQQIPLPNDKHPTIYPGDFNGDSKMDLAFYVRGGMKVAYNLFNDEGGFRIQGPSPMSNRELVTGDFNGDGKTDFVDKRSNVQYAIYYSTQDGFTGENVHTLPSTYPDYECMHNRPNACGYVDMVFADVTGDGCTDVVQLCVINKPEGAMFRQHADFNQNPSADLPRMKVWGEYGPSLSILPSERERIKKELTDMRIVPMQWVSLRVNGRVLERMDKAKAVLNIGKFSGQGGEQILFDCNDNTYRNFVGASEGGHGVYFIGNNGLGLDTHIFYKDLSNDPDYKYDLSKKTATVRDYVAAIPVVSSVRVGRGREDLNETFYRYENLKLNMLGRGLLGFSKITVTDRDSQVRTENNYALDSYCNMNPGVSITYGKSGGIISIETSIFSLTKCSEGVVSGLCYVSNLKKHGITDNLKLTTIETTNEYTSSGFLQKKDVSYGNGEAKSTAYYEYATVGRAAYPNKLARSSETFIYGTGAPAISTKEYSYDGKGNVLTETLYPGKDGELKTSYTYNATGLPTEVSVSNKNRKKRTTSYEYDHTYRFMTKTTNPLKQSISRKYDEATGLLVSETNDVTSHTMKYEYDAFGRLSSVEDPWGQKQRITTGWASNTSIDCPAGTAYFVKVEKPNTPYQKEFYDVLGRKLRTDTENLNGVSKVDYVYNKLGQLEKQSLPYSGNYIPGWTKMTYDNYGRLQSQDNGDAVTTYSYNAKLLTITTPSGQKVKKKTDSLDDVVRVEDAAGGVVEYKYNAFRQISEVKTPDGVIKIDYDEYGRKKTLNDPNTGKVSYAYNAFGELISQTDANGNLSTMTYDDFGRILTKKRAGDTTTYNYDDKGRLKSAVASNGFGQYYTYNDRGQLSLFKELIAGKEYSTVYGYDKLGNNTSLVYPSGFSISKSYTSCGFLNEILRTDDSSLIWKLNTANANGQVTQYTNGNGLETSVAYDVFGRPNSIKTGKVQELNYKYNSQTGTLSERKDVLKGLTESFGYDALNRLTHYQVNNLTGVELSYSETGNINSKSDLGDYLYHPVKKNAVDTILVNKQNLTLPEQRVTYTAFNKVAGVQHDGDTRQEFLYGPDEQRHVSNIYSGTTLVSHKIYSENYEEEMKSGRIIKRHYIDTPAGVTAMFMEVDNVGNMYYFCKDPQNSITALVDKSGVVKEEYAYDPWGQRRNPQNWTYDNVAVPELLDRGYTMHEHLNQFGLINMNGRMYDPFIARILSPDNLVPDVFSLQGYNRYTYCYNNPLSYVDPDGNNPLGWILAGAIWLGKWFHDGREANHNNPNPLKWDYSKMNYSIGISCSSGGCFSGYGGIGWNNDYKIAIGYSANNYAFGYIHDGIPRLGTPQYVPVNPAAKVSEAINEAREEYSMYKYLSTVNGCINTINGVAQATTLAGQGLYVTSKGLIRSINYGRLTMHSQPYAQWGKLMRNTGYATIIAGFAFDICGVLKDEISEPKFYMNSGVSLGGITLSALDCSLLGLALTGTYFGVDTFYPGGWEGVMEVQDRVLRTNQELLGARFNLYKDWIW